MPCQRRYFTNKRASDWRKKQTNGVFSNKEKTNQRCQAKLCTFFFLETTSTQQKKNTMPHFFCVSSKEDTIDVGSVHVY